MLFIKYKCTRPYDVYKRRIIRTVKKDFEKQYIFLFHYVIELSQINTITYNVCHVFAGGNAP